MGYHYSLNFSINNKQREEFTLPDVHNIFIFEIFFKRKAGKGFAGRRTVLRIYLSKQSCLL